ncbi:MAG: PAS domain S-box protein [Singulisphaera sp.]
MTERRRAERRVQQSEARKAAILETALDAILTIDHEGKLVEINPAAETIFGHARGDILGREMCELFVPPSLRGAHRRGLAHYLATGEGPVLGRRFEAAALRADGAEFPVELAITPISADGPPMFTAHVRDITERKRFERRREARLAVTEILAGAPSIDEAIPKILGAVGEGLGWDVGELWAVAPEGDRLHCLGVWHAPGHPHDEFEATARRSTFPRGVGLPGRVWSGGGPCWIPDVTADPNFPRASVAAREGLHGAFGCPISLGGEVLGAVAFYSGEVRQPDDDTLEMMATLGGQIGQFFEPQEGRGPAGRADPHRRGVAPHRRPPGGGARPPEGRPGRHRRADPADRRPVRGLLRRGGRRARRVLPASTPPLAPHAKPPRSSRCPGTRPCSARPSGAKGWSGWTT